MILTGWKSVAMQLGGCTIKTAKKRARIYKMPIVYLGGKPTISDMALEKWWGNLKDNLYKQKEKMG